MTTTLAVIPARLESTRLPSKVLEMLGGRPLVVRVAEQAKKTKKFKDVIVATDAQEVVASCVRYGIAWQMTASNHRSGTDRVAEVAECLGAESIVNLQGDEPFVDPRDLDAIVSALGAGDPVVTLRAPISEIADYYDPSVVKVLGTEDGRALYFSRAPIPYGLETKTLTDRAFRHLGVYGYKVDALRAWTQAPRHPLEEVEKLEQLRALAMGIPITLLDAYTRGRGIDTAADLEWARAQWQQFGEDAFPRGRE